MTFSILQKYMDAIERRRKTYEMLEAQHRQSPLSCNCNCNCDCGSKPDPIPSLVPLICWGVEKIQDWRNRKKSTPTISDTIERLQQNQNDISERLRQI